MDAADVTVYDFPETARSANISMINAAYDIIFLPDAGTAYAVNVPARALSVIDRATGAVLRTISGLGEIFRVRASTWCAGTPAACLAEWPSRPTGGPSSSSTRPAG